MTVSARDYEIAWLKELEKRIAQDLPADTREMMVALRDQLPRGFKPSDIGRSLVYGVWPSVAGIRTIGDESGLVADIERGLLWVRERLIEHPALQRVTADELAVALRSSVKRAERVLFLMSSLGQFSSGASGSEYGFSSISLGREDIVAEYLRFRNVDELLADQPAPRNDVPSIVFAPPAEGPRVRPMDTAFILMSMDPQDDSLADICEAIKRVCALYGIKALRIDDVEHQERITDRILEMIDDCELVIADLTGERPNVYYEVGYAHAVGKRPILYRKKGTRLHFDLSVHNVPEYRNVTELTALLRKRLEAILGRGPGRGASVDPSDS